MSAYNETDLLKEAYAAGQKKRTDTGSDKVSSLILGRYATSYSDGLIRKFGPLDPKLYKEIKAEFRKGFRSQK